MNHIGKILIIVGAMILITGLIINFAGDKLNWFGNTPLDFKYEGESTRFYAPIGSMIIISVGLTLILNILARWFK